MTNYEDFILINQRDINGVKEQVCLSIFDHLRSDSGSGATSELHHAFVEAHFYGSRAFRHVVQK